MPALRELARLQERWRRVGLSSADVTRYVRLEAEIGRLPADLRYLLDQPLTFLTPEGFREPED
jgi:hypothetical protein